MPMLLAEVLPTTPSAMDNLSTVGTSILGWLGNMVTTVTGSPILLIGVGFFVIGGAIGLVKRLIH